MIVRENLNCEVGIFFLRFDVFRTGRLLKFRPLNSESESSTYSKSELCADKESERSERSFWLAEEMGSKEDFRLVSILLGSKGGGTSVGTGWFKVAELQLRT